MERFSGNLVNIQSMLPHDNVGNAETEDNLVNFNMVNNSNMVGKVIDQQSKMLSQQQIMLNKMSDQLKYLQKVINTLLTEMKAKNNPSPDYIQKKPQTVYHDYYSSDTNCYCTWCGSNRHLWKKCYRRLRRCFRCGSSSHQVANCYKPSPLFYQKFHGNFRTRKPLYHKQVAPKSYKSPISLNSKAVTDSLLTSTVSNEISSSQSNHVQSLGEASSIPEVCKVQPCLLNNDLKVGGNINSSESDLSLKLPESVLEEIPCQNACVNGNCLIDSPGSAQTITVPRFIVTEEYCVPLKPCLTDNCYTNDGNSCGTVNTVNALIVTDIDTDISRDPVTSTTIQQGEIKTSSETISTEKNCFKQIVEEKLNLYPEKFPETVNSEIESIISSDYETVQS